MATLELYGSSHCPYTQELRDWLEWTRRDFREYDVEIDPEASARIIATGKFRRSRTRNNSAPTAPVAPTIAM